MTAQPAARFPLGQVVATPGAIAALARSGDTAAAFLARHEQGDWGDVPPEDAASNEDALVDGGRILSSYRLGDGTVVWLITEADRSVTTVLLPSDY